MLQPLKHVCLYLKKLQKDGKKRKSLFYLISHSLSLDLLTVSLLSGASQKCDLF